MLKVPNHDGGVILSGGRRGDHSRRTYPENSSDPHNVPPNAVIPTGVRLGGRSGGICGCIFMASGGTPFHVRLRLAFRTARRPKNRPEKPLFPSSPPLAHHVRFRFAGTNYRRIGCASLEWVDENLSALNPPRLTPTRCQ